MSYEIDGVIEAWLNAGEGASGVKWNQPYTETLIAQAFKEAIASPIGRELSSRVGDKFNARIMVELSKRFDNAILYKGVYTRARIEEVMRDLLLEAPPAPVRPPGINEHGVNLNFDAMPEKPKPNKEQSGFAHAWAKTVREKGIAAVKPRAGVVTLMMPNGSEYEYSAQEANRLLNQCIALGLVD